MPGRVGRFDRSVLHALYDANEAEAFARQRLDETLLFTAVADGASYDVQTGRERGIGYRASVPDRADQLILADDAVPVTYQVGEQVKDLRRHGQRIGSAMKLAPLDVQCMALEEIAQDAPPLDQRNITWGATQKIRLW